MSNVELIDGIDPVYGEPREQVMPRKEVASVLAQECGYTIHGEHVFCDDRRLDALDEGKALRYDVCDCKTHATAVLNRLRELGAFNDQFYDAIDAERKSK